MLGLLLLRTLLLLLAGGIFDWSLFLNRFFLRTGLHYHILMLRDCVLHKFIPEALVLTSLHTTNERPSFFRLFSQILDYSLERQVFLVPERG